LKLKPNSSIHQPASEILKHFIQKIKTLNICDKYVITENYFVTN